MSFCFVDPADAIHVIADSIGREARRQLLGEALRAWVDEIPEEERGLHDAPVSRLWTGDAWQALRERLARGEFFPGCSRCGKFEQTSKWASKLQERAA